MRYFFVLGRNPAVSAAEILACTHGESVTVSELHKQALVLSSPDELDPVELMARLGGTIKAGRLTEHLIPVDGDGLTELLMRLLSARPEDGKLSFGFSVYALEGPKPAAKAAQAFAKLKRSGMEAKRRLKESGRSCRWVRPQTGTALSSVVVEKNGLAKAGTEFVLLVKDDQMYVGVTEAVQPFEEFSRTDYGRPGRDAKRGMLPPKLARMLLNLACVRPGTDLWDPFCGSGTIVTEALRLGCLHVSGSDLSAGAVKDTRANIDWMKERGQVPPAAEIALFENDARQAPTELRPGGLEAIVTEPYLGPPREGRESKPALEKRLDELSGLYRDSLRTWRPLLRDDGCLVLALPLYIVGLDRLGVSVPDIAGDLYEADPLIPPMLMKRMGVRETANRGVTYGRPDQHVWREIVRLRPV
ncbi:TRM11 family SAM-dependent methyltransferase [Patescibacteria group bacterium]